MSSCTSSPRTMNDFDNDDRVSSIDEQRDLDVIVSDEDTEDASETEEKTGSGIRTEIKEQMYQDKLFQLKKQLCMLNDGILPEFVKKGKKISQAYSERQRLCNICRDLELERARSEYEKEIKDADKDHMEKVKELKEHLLSEWNDKKLMLETEHHSMDLANGDVFDVKPMMTRKLRRRPNDPTPIPLEKRRKTSPASVNIALLEDEVQEDADMLQKVCGRPPCKKPQLPVTPPADGGAEVRLDDNRLYIDKKYYYRGQNVVVQSKEMGKFCAQITNFVSQEVSLRRLTDGTKHRIPLVHLQKGKYSIQRRA